MSQLPFAPKHRRAAFAYGLYAAGLFLLTPMPASAQDEPLGRDFEGAIDADISVAEGPDGRPDQNQASWTANAGGVLNTGNTRSLALNAGTRALVSRGQNQFSGDVQFAYGRASVQEEDNPGTFSPWTTNTNNLNAQARYDRFLTLRDGLFVGSRLRHDRFAGLELRLQGQTGYVRSFVRQENYRIWGEVGYDLTYDDLFPDGGDDYVHSVRGFFGYENQINPILALITGLEGLYDVQDAENVRVQWVSEVVSKIDDNFQLNLTFAARFDNVPVEGREELDTLTTLNLVMTLL